MAKQNTGDGTGALNGALRRQAIADLIQAEHAVEVGALATEFGVSDMTIRRDLQLLEGDGCVRRIRGGAISTLRRGQEPPLDARAATNAAAKRGIALAATELVTDGDTVVIDVGTTALAFARALRGRRCVTVITPSLPVATELGADPGMRVIVTGGLVRTTELSLVGGAAERTFDELNCDLAVVGVSGVDIERGLSDYSPEDSRVKRAFMRVASQTVVLADATKLGEVSLFSFAPLRAIDAIVTDAPRDHDLLAVASDIGIAVHSTADERGRDATVAPPEHPNQEDMTTRQLDDSEVFKQLCSLGSPGTASRRWPTAARRRTKR